MMSMLAECQPFVHHGLGEMRAKPPASGPPAMGWVTTRDHIHVMWIWSDEQSIVNGVRQKKSDPAGYRTRVAGSVVWRTNHYTTKTSWKRRVMRYIYITRSDTCSSIKLHKVAVWSQILTIVNGDILILQSTCSAIIVGGWIRVR
jgi:hypothetical protein